MNETRRRIPSLLSFGCALLFAACATAPRATTSVQPALAVRIIPAPASLTLGTGAAFDLNRSTAIVADVSNAEVGQIANALAARLRPPTQFALAIAAAPTAGANFIALRLSADRASLGEEGYALTVTADSVVLLANRPAGLFRGIQSIRQLLPTAVESEIGVDRAVWPIPPVTIVDQPRFAWRGAMLDVARHFFTPREVEQYIDILAMYKMNVLHLHLADDQGWRIVINSRPKLATLGGATQVGGGPGGFYTQQEYQDIVRYAQARYITIVPEIDMPSHINAALVGYPELGCSARPTGLFTGTDVGWSSLCVDKEETYALVDDVVREIAAITPGPYFHIGGDEVQTLTNDQYIRFVERAQSIVNKYGKTMVGWEEVTKARLNASTLAQQWKSDSVTAALQYGTRIIMSPSSKVYIDMKYTAATELGLRWAGLVEVRDSYDWDPAMFVKGITESNLVGVEAPMWSETLQNISAVEYLAIPRLPAIAEVAWTPQASRDWEDFRTRLAAQAPRWRYLGINYYRSPQIAW